LNWGCIPTKALLRSAEVLHLAQNAQAFGVNVQGASHDLPKMVRRSRDISAQLAGGIKHLLQKHKVEVRAGEAVLTGQGGVTVDGKAMPRAKNIILATGARARTLPGLEPDGKRIWTAQEAMTPKALPKSLLVVGAGAIGIEFASFYNALGAKVTVVELADRILPAEDAEISVLAEKAFISKGINIFTKTKVEKLGKVTATLSNGQEVDAEKVLLAVGIVGNTDGIGLEKTQAKVGKGHIVTGPLGETGEPGLWAIGDVAGPPWLAHKASHEGVACAEAIAGLHPHPVDPLRIPGCTYASPQVASVGLSEQAAKDRGKSLKIGRFPFLANGKALAMGEAEGLVKTIFDAETGELLGAHMIGAEATEMIQGFAVAMGLETTEEDLMRTIFPHPTLSEMMHESVLAAYGRAIHT
ncbi:MAG TPA: dihydrolipoyl dehydrogenase, partial [Rhodospirillaceae bacterium]|nr:dihydrolipoyl dehydrogenase [Rhodospirillaceae bacterium]